LQAAGLFLFVEGAAPDPALGDEGQYALKTERRRNGKRG